MCWRVAGGEGLAAMSSFYWYPALLACIGGFLFGYDTAVIGSVLDFIPYHLSLSPSPSVCRSRCPSSEQEIA
jgi:hypothetical protein